MKKILFISTMIGFLVTVMGTFLIPFNKEIACVVLSIGVVLLVIGIGGIMFGDLLSGIKSSDFWEGDPF